MSFFWPYLPHDFQTKRLCKKMHCLGRFGRRNPFEPFFFCTNTETTTSHISCRTRCPAQTAPHHLTWRKCQPDRVQGLLAPQREHTNELAKARAQDTVNNHLLNQAQKADPRMRGGASCALLPSIWNMKSTASSLHRSSVSKPTTTSWHRSLWSNSWYLRSLSIRAVVRTTPRGVAVQPAVNTERMVMSTAN